MIWETMQIQMAVRHVANYNNNGQHKELTMHAWAISSRYQPMIIQFDPVNQK